MTKVRDIENTIKVLKRMENYSYKYMNEVCFEQAEVPLAEARETMKTLLNNFLNTEISELRPAFNEERAKIKYLEQDVEMLRELIEHDSKAIEEYEEVDEDDREWMSTPTELLQDIERREQEITEKTADIERLKEIISK